MKPLIAKRFPLRENVYNRAVTFLFGSIDQINTRLRRDTPDEKDFWPIEESALGHWRIIKQAGYEADYICIASDTSRAEQMQALAHECLHHTSHALRMAGLPLKRSSEEAYCYYLGWMVDKCVTVIDPRAHE